jgi:two-component system NtrC family sensor kinase
MTTREAAEAARREASELRAIASLARGVAHEINNPLMVIMGQLELLGLDLAPAGKAAERLQRAVAAAEDIRAITARMTGITRVHTAPMGEHLAPFLDLGRSSEAG